MRKIYLLLLVSFYYFSDSCAQALNDDCETAIDISNAFSNIDTLVACISNFSEVYTGTGRMFLDFEKATISNPNYISNDCWGYARQTNAEFVDLWYKITDFPDTKNFSGFVYELFVPLDTLHVATYYGNCDSLYQDDCWTFTSEQNWQTGRGHGFSVRIPYQESIQPNHDFYIQFRVPQNKKKNEYVCVAEHYAFTTYSSYSYDRPAINAFYHTTNNDKIVQFYPNPTKSVLYWRTVENINIRGLEIHLYSSVGKLERAYKAENILDVSNIPTGIYFAEVRQNGKVISRERIMVH